MAKREKLSGALQENILALLTMSDDYAAVVRNSIDLPLYSNEIYRNIATRSYDYIDSFKKAPKDHLPDIMEDYVGDDREGMMYAQALQDLRQLGETLNVRYVLNNLGSFVQEHTLRIGIIEAAAALQNEDVDSARAVIEAALARTAPTFEPGLTLLNAIGQLRRGEDERDVMPLGIKPLDDYDLGPARQELWLAVGGPKRGKTFLLAHIARAALLDRRRVLYITLEVRDQIIAKRLLQSIGGLTAKIGEEISLPQIQLARNGMITHIDYSKSTHLSLKDPKGLNLVDKRVQQLRLDSRFLVKSFATGSLTVRDLTAYLDQLERQHKFIPDLLILDYADLMHVEQENFRISLSTMLKDLRGLSVSRNMAIATASQLNRAGAGRSFATEQHIAEDFSKIAIADTTIIINQISEEKKRGLARLYVAAARNDRDRFSVLVTQSFELGQFAVSAQLEPAGYNAFLRRMGEEPADEEDED